MEAEAGPEVVVIRYHRLKDRAVLMDDNFELHRIADLRRAATQNANFTILDSDTGEDITRILLA